MSIRDGIHTASSKMGFKLGVDNTTVIGDDALLGTLSEAFNTDLINDVLCRKRFGYQTVATWDTKKIRQGFEYTTPGGAKEVLLFGQDSAPTGTSGVLGKQNSTSTPTTLLSGLADGNKPTILQFGAYGFFFDGVNDSIYDGTNFRQIGITEPTVAPSSNTLIPGSLNSAGSYLFVYTYFNSSTGAESSPSPPSDIIVTGTTAATQGITINITAGNATTADKIKVYRTVSSGGTWFLDGETTIASTTYDSTISDAVLGTELEQDNTRPPKALIATSADNRLFIVSALNKSRIQYSKIGLSGPMPESFQVSDFVDCGTNDGDEIVALGKTNSTVVVIKKRSCGRLIPIDTQTSGLERFGSQKYLYEEISRETTGLTKDTLIALDTAVVWLGEDDIYITDGLNVKRIGGRILTTLKTLNLSKKHLFSGVNNPETKQIFWSVCLNGDTEPNFQIVGHYQALPQVSFTFYSPGTDTSTHPGIRAASLFRVTENNKSRLFFGNSNGNGKFYRMGAGDNDDSSGIYWSVKLPWRAGKDPSRLTVFHSFYTFASSGGAANELTHTFESDLNEQVIVTEDTVVPGLVAWNSSDWGDFTWAGSVAFSPQKFFPRTRCYWGRYGFSNIDADQPFLVQSITAITQATGKS